MIFCIPTTQYVIWIKHRHRTKESKSNNLSNLSFRAEILHSSYRYPGISFYLLSNWPGQK